VRDIKPAKDGGCNAYSCPHNPTRKDKKYVSGEAIRAKRINTCFDMHKESDTVIEVMKLDLRKIKKGVSKVQVLVGDSELRDEVSIMDMDIHQKFRRRAESAVLDSGADMVIAGEEMWDKVQKEFKEVKMKTLERPITAIMANESMETCDKYFTVPLLSLLLPSGKQLKIKDIDVLYMSHLREVIVGNSVLYGVFKISLVEIMERLDSDLVYTFKRLHIEDAESGKVKERRLINQYAGEA
jgi:hypothetical protein